MLFGLPSSKLIICPTLRSVDGARRLKCKLPITDYWYLQMHCPSGCIETDPYIVLPVVLFQSSNPDTSSATQSV